MVSVEFLPHFAADLFSHIVVEEIEEVVLFERRNEFAWGEKTIFWIFPSRERLKGDKISGRCDDGLVVGLDIAVLDCLLNVFTDIFSLLVLILELLIIFRIVFERISLGILKRNFCAIDEDGRL